GRGGKHVGQPKSGERGGNRPGQKTHHQPSNHPAADEAEQQLRRPKWRREQVHHGPLQLGDEKRGAGVQKRVVGHPHEYQTGHDEDDVGNGADLLDPAAERVSENHEIQAGADQRRKHRLPRNSEKPTHLFGQERFGADDIHAHAPRDSTSLPYLSRTATPRSSSPLSVSSRAGTDAGSGFGAPRSTKSRTSSSRDLRVSTSSTGRWAA